MTCVADCPATLMKRWSVVNSQHDGHVKLPRTLDCVVTEQLSGSALVVTASGAIDMLTAPKLADQITASLAKRPTALIVDLSAVDFLATAGMEVLIGGNRAASSEVRFAVVADGPATSRPLKITGIAEIIDLFATLDEALEKLAA
jgi:anti-anti-sigma factor